MYYLTVVFVKEPTEEAVAKALEEFKNSHWDWYRIGGRWDGWLQGEEEMKKRETDHGFNFAPENRQISRNFCKVKEHRWEETPHIFVDSERSYFLPRTYYDEFALNISGRYGDIVDTPHWQVRWEETLAYYRDDFAVVVDIHN